MKDPYRSGLFHNVTDGIFCHSSSLCKSDGPKKKLKNLLSIFLSSLIILYSLCLPDKLLELSLYATDLHALLTLSVILHVPLLTYLFIFTLYLSVLLCLCKTISPLFVASGEC